MKKTWLKFDSEHLLEILTLLAIFAVVVLIMRFVPGIGSFFGKIVKVLVPFMIGFAITLILRPLEQWTENWLAAHTKWQPKLRRGAAVTFSEAVLILLITLFFVLVIPQLVNSLVTIAQSIGTYAETVQKWIDSLGELSGNAAQLGDSLLTYLTDSLTSITKGLTDNLPTIINTAISSIQQLITGIGNFFIGLIISIYLLAGYEKIARHFKMLIQAVFPAEVSDEIKRLIHVSIDIFTHFVAGKAVDSLIIGIMCLIGCLIFGWEFPYLIAFIVGVTNMIPFFGPFIGAIPCILILLLINPWNALWFAIFILALQQFDGNFLGPHILGGSLGLPSIMIIFSVLVGGGLFGIWGMFLGVPFFAFVYTMIKEFVHRRLGEKEAAAPSA